MIFALDTNIVVELLRHRESSLAEKFLRKTPCDYSVPEMVRAELLFGAQVSARPEENRVLVENFLEPLRLLPFGGQAAKHYAEIRSHLQRSGKPIGANDLIIAATTRAMGHTLITRNTSEFFRVPALAIEEW